MRWTWDLQPHGGLRMIRPVIMLIGRRRERIIWTRLKRVLEAMSSPATPARLGP
jgi:hypothetical protein